MGGSEAESARVKPPNGKRIGSDGLFQAKTTRPNLGGSPSDFSGASQRERELAQRTQPRGAGSLVSGYNLPLQGQTAAN